MADATTPKKQNPGGSQFADDDVVQFDLGSDTDETAGDLHVNLEDNGDTEEVSTPPPVRTIPVDFEQPTQQSSSAGISFSLGGDDVLDLFETLMQRIEELKSNHEESIHNHRENISRENEAIKKEESEYQQKLSKMLERIENLKNKLSNVPAPKPMKKAA